MNEETDLTDVPKMSTLNHYYEEQAKYSKIYGDRTIVFFEMGKFYDAYCTTSTPRGLSSEDLCPLTGTPTKGYAKLEELEKLLRIQFIRREPNSKTNPQNRPSQFGIHTVSIKKNLMMLVENGYTIVLFDQKKDGDRIDRVCVGVFSPGTHIPEHDTAESNYIMTVYISEEKQLFATKSLLAIGLAIVDVSTGSSTVYEFYGDKNDERFGLDELNRTMQIFRPTELVIYYQPAVVNEAIMKSMKQYLELEKFKNCHFYVYHDKKGTDELDLLYEDVFRIDYQNDYLAGVYSLTSQSQCHNNTSPLEILHLEQKTYANIALLILLKYISMHNMDLLRNLSYPEIYVYNSHLILGNNATEQLNILDANNLELFNARYKSVMDVVNHTSTPMGKRFLRESLLNPLSQENKTRIIQRYSIIEELLAGNLYKTVTEDLKRIYDVERIHRRMGMGSIVPYEFYRLDQCYQATSKIIEKIKGNATIRTLCPDHIIREFLAFQYKYWQEYDVEKMQRYHGFNDVSGSFFKAGIHPELDALQEKLDYVRTLVTATQDYLTSLLSSTTKGKGKGKAKTLKETVDFDTNERDGYHFTVTKTNEKYLRAIVDKKQNLDVPLVTGKSLRLSKADFEFRPLPKGRTKIFIKPLLEHTDRLTERSAELAKLIQKLFIKSMVDYFTQHRTMMHAISKFIAEIDFLISGASVASTYFYCKPEIPSQANVPCYIKTRQLRHAIIERLCTETEYVPNDIDIGNTPADTDATGDNGMLIYGINSAGKSSFMKSIGVALILAQIGYYVPAEQFVYEPYMALYARITGNDNIFKGLSSFALEMTELDAILLRTQAQGDRTIVIGDEVCRGTEEISGLALVASALQTLSRSNTTFIFSSHLHGLPELPEVQELTNLRLYHLRVEYDTANDCLLFDRKLTTGSGPRVYGLNVAKHLVKNQDFINCADRIMKRLTAKYEAETNMPVVSIPTKRSKYNSNRLVRYCSICNYAPHTEHHRELETHHIHFQSNCCSSGKIIVKPHLTKNELYNLVVLCRKCHTRVHQREIVVRGYIDTSVGPLLDYTVDTRKSMDASLDLIDKLERTRTKTRAKVALTPKPRTVRTQHT